MKNEGAFRNSRQMHISVALYTETLGVMSAFLQVI